MYGEKQTKNVITKETVAAELERKTKRSGAPFVIVLVVYVVGVVAMAAILYPLMRKSVEFGTVGNVIFFGTVALLLFPVLKMVLTMAFHPRASRKSFDEEAFYVITDEVLYKEEKTYHCRGTVTYKRVLYFRRCGEIEVNATWYQLTSENDLYYMVVHDKNSKYASLCYPTKLYEYREEDS